MSEVGVLLLTPYFLLLTPYFSCSTVGSGANFGGHSLGAALSLWLHIPVSFTPRTFPRHGLLQVTLGLLCPGSGNCQEGIS